MLTILLLLIFIRPFISSLAFPEANFIYSSALLFLLAFWLINKGISLKKMDALRYPLILLCLALSISISFSQDKLNSLTESYKYISGLSLFLIMSSLALDNKIRVIHTITLTGFIISLVAIYQYLFGFSHILEYMAKANINNPFALGYIRSKRIFFPFITPNILAGYLSMIIPLAFINKNRIRLLAPLFLALLLTKSMGGLLSLFLGLAIYSYLEGKADKKKVLLLFGLLIAIGAIFILRSTLREVQVQPITSVTTRWNYWKETLKIIKSSPWVGVGPGNVNLAQSRYTHNSYLQIWAEAGILGIISLLWLTVAAFMAGLKNTQEAKYKKVNLCLITASAIFLIHNLVDFSFSLPEVNIIWWVIVGLMV